MTKSLTVATRVPSIPLSNGVQLPALGLGVFKSLAAIDALDSGVRGGPAPESINRKNFNFQIPD